MHIMCASDGLRKSNKTAWGEGDRSILLRRLRKIDQSPAVLLESLSHTYCDEVTFQHSRGGEMETEPKNEAAPKPPIPAWAWVFAVACGIIPVLTLGGAIPAAIGFGGAAGCVGTARNPAMSLGA